MLWNAPFGPIQLVVSFIPEYPSPVPSVPIAPARRAKPSKCHKQLALMKRGHGPWLHVFPSSLLPGWAPFLRASNLPPLQYPSFKQEGRINPTSLSQNMLRSCSGLRPLDSHSCSKTGKRDAEGPKPVPWIQCAHLIHIDLSMEQCCFHGPLRQKESVTCPDPSLLACNSWMRSHDMTCLPGAVA